jgi:hypothetical protein
MLVIKLTINVEHVKAHVTNFSSITSVTAQGVSGLNI